MINETEKPKSAPTECNGNKGMSVRDSFIISSFYVSVLGYAIIIIAMFAMVESKHYFLWTLVSLAGAVLCWLGGAYYSRIDAK